MEENKPNDKPVEWGNTPYGRATDFSPIVRVLPKIKRNAVCPFSGKKFKNCCGARGQDYCNRSKENLEKYLNDLKNKNTSIEKINQIAEDDKNS
jgi:hypothetical protein